jgi:2-amino-4-hydroxy-6-hydroxymethyldihydropteridine diphosphokinase
MILIALGSNLAGAAGTPVENCERALVMLQAAGVRVLRRSRWYRTPPWPPSDQPWFINGVVAVETALGPAELLATMHEVERAMGRTREAGVVNAARVIDLDLIDYNGVLREAVPPLLPHPRLNGRAFVLKPMAEVAPDWRHPKTGQSMNDLLAQLPGDAVAEPLPPAA